MKSSTPSPLDLGYQTLEHSYDGESSLSSDTQRGPDRLEVVPASNLSPVSLLSLLSLPDSLLTRLLSHLSAPDLARLSSTCRRLARLAWQPQLWTNILLADERLDVDRAIRSILARLVWGPRAGGREREEPLRGAVSVLTVRLGGSARLTDRTLALLARNCPSLARLELQRCRNVTNGGILDLMTRCSRLQHLDLTGKTVNNNSSLLMDITLYKAVKIQSDRLILIDIFYNSKAVILTEIPFSCR